jgi:hypothetical protein
MSIPVQGWSLLRLDPPHSIILHVGGEQLRVRVAGRWEPPEPEHYLPSPTDPPQPKQSESHLSFALRYLQWTLPTQSNPEWLRWNALKKWTGETIAELRDRIESDISIPNDCF